VRKKSPKVQSHINRLILNGYFEKCRTLPEITAKIIEDSGEKYYTNQVSGIILVLVRQNKLSRAISPNGMYVYSEGSVCPN